MPRKYKRKTDKQVNENGIKNAIRAVFKNESGLNKAARLYGIKRTTLQSRIKKLRARRTNEEIVTALDDSGNESNEQSQNKYGNKYTVTQVFTQDEEMQLRKYIQHSSDLNYGLNYVQIQKLAYEYAIKLPNCRIPENWHNNKQAGIEWRKGFMERNRNYLSLRKPDSTSLLRGTGFNRTRVEEFFTNYGDVLQRYKFHADQIYNRDETGISTVLKPIKVVSTKGKKQVGQVASGERGELVTFVGIISATGNTVPPVFLYPRILNPAKYMINPPVSSLALGNRSGWMTKETFPEVLKHIVLHTRCSKENKILLMIDNHESHTSVQCINFCRENGIVLLSYPPHTTHRLQPLDVGIYGPFKNKLAIAFNEWMLSNPGKVISIRNIAELANTAFLNSFTPANIISSFRSTGIWPVNRFIFTDVDFAPSSVTEREEPRRSTNEDGIIERIVERETTPIREEMQAVENIDDPQPSTSKNVNNDSTLLETIRPFPKAKREEKIRKKKRESKSKIYTDTPELILKQNTELERERKKSLTKTKTVKRKVFSHAKNKAVETSSSDSDINVEVMNSSDDDESIMPLQYVEENEDFALNDFVLVKFRKLNNDLCYYIGQIMEIKNEEFQIKFLRRRGNSANFCFPAVEDISVIQKEDIAAKLLAPNKPGTIRTQSLFCFSYDFRGLDVR